VAKSRWQWRNEFPQFWLAVDIRWLEANARSVSVFWKKITQVARVWIDYAIFICYFACFAVMNFKNYLTVRAASREYRISFDLHHSHAHDAIYQTRCNISHFRCSYSNILFLACAWVTATIFTLLSENTRKNCSIWEDFGLGLKASQKRVFREHLVLVNSYKKFFRTKNVCI